MNSAANATPTAALLRVALRQRVSCSRTDPVEAVEPQVETAEQQAEALAAAAAPRNVTTAAATPTLRA
jgi:hypothetical protein